MKLCRYSILLETSALDVSNTDGLAVRTSGAGATLVLYTLRVRKIYLATAPDVLTSWVIVPRDMKVM